MVEQAKQMANELGSIKNSITKGKGNEAGYLAELAVAAHLGAEHVSCDEGKEKHNWDLILPNGKTIDVKTKRRVVIPKPSYDVSIAATSKHQQCDGYCFVSLCYEEYEGKGKHRVYKNLLNIWLCGFMSKEEYFQNAVYWPKGTVDQSNWFRTHTSMYNMAIKDLHTNIEDCWDE